MPKKPLLPIIIVLLGILSLILFINRQSIYQKYIVLRERNERLQIENKELSQRLSESQEERRRLLERMEVIQKDLDSVSKECDEWKNKFEIASKEREELIEKLKTVPRVVAPPKEITPSREDVYWATVLKDKASLELQVSSLKDEISSLKDEIFSLKSSLEKTDREKVNLELELKGLTNQIQDLERQVKYNDQLASNLSNELVREKEDKRALSEQIRLVKEENTLFKRQLNQTENERVKLKERLKKTEDEKSTLDRRLAEMEKILGERVEELVEAKKILGERVEELVEAKKGIKEVTIQAKGISPEETRQVELPPIVVRPQEVPLISAPSVSGKIIAVNREHNFVIIDLGEEHGIKPGRTFEIFRDQKLIGRLEVIQTRSSVSACDITQKSVDLKVGDIIR